MRNHCLPWRALLAAVPLLAMLVAVVPPASHALDTYRPAVREPIVPGIRPAPRAAPAPRPLTQPSTLPAPKRIPPGGIGLSPSIVRPITPGPNCRPSCGSRCQMVTCNGLNSSQCASVRQRCRAACSSRCD